MLRVQALTVLLAAACAWGCGAPEPPGSSGGTNVQSGDCGRGMVVVNTDFQSTNVSLVGVDGAVLSPSFISSATTDAKLSAKLTGDVVTTTSPSAGSDVVLIDRYPASVLTWVDVETASVKRQLSVRTGFDANPHDYVELSATKAYVSRYEANVSPGQEPFDGGDDVLVVDPSVPEIVGRIALDGAMAGESDQYHATPHRLVRTPDAVIALLLGENTGHSDAAASRLVAIDSKADTLGDVMVLSGLYECLGLALSPDSQRLALSCAGRFGGDSEPELAEGGVVVVDVAAGLVEVQRFSAKELGASPGYGISWASKQTLVVTTLGAFGGGGAPARADAVLEIDLVTSEVRELLTSKDEPFTLSDVRCAASCGACFMTDAGRGVAFRANVADGGRVGTPESLIVDQSIGLPPRWLGQF